MFVIIAVTKDCRATREYPIIETSSQSLVTTLDITKGKFDRWIKSINDLPGPCHIPQAQSWYRINSVVVVVDVIRKKRRGRRMDEGKAAIEDGKLNTYLDATGNVSRAFIYDPCLTFP